VVPGTMLVSSMTDGDGAAGGRDETAGGMEGAGEETEVDTTGGGLTEELERPGGKLTAGLVGFKKTVEMTVTVTGLPAAGSVAWGVPFWVEEGGRPPSPVNPLGNPGNATSVGRGEGLTVGMAGGDPDGMEEEQSDGMEDGSTVADGSTAVDVPGVPLERVASGLSNEASLRTRLGYPSSTVSRAHQDPTRACQPV